MSKKFSHLKLSPHWQQYFSKYPQGYTIIENLIDWVSQVDNMVDNQNELNATVNTFGDRLDEFIGQYDTHLQETVEQTLSDWQNSGFLNVIINETLNTKYHEMDNRLSTQLSDTDREVRRKREPEDLSERTLGLITGEGGTISLESIPQDYSVHPGKTTFAKGGGGVNLWDGSFHYLGLSGNAPYTAIETANRQGIIVKVNPGTTYIMSKEVPPSGEQNYFRMGFFTEKPVAGSTPTRRLTEGYSLPYQRTFTTEPDEFYVLVQTAGASSGTRPKWFQLEEGEQVSTYVDPSERVFIDLDLKSHNKIIGKSKVNLWDSKFYKISLSGTSPFTVVEAGVAQGAIVELKPNTTYTISKSQPIGGEQNFLRTGLFTEKPVIGSTPTRRIVEGYSAPYQRTFTTEYNETYALVQTAGANTGTPPQWFQIEENDEATSYEPPYVVKESMLPKKFIETVNQGAKTFSIKGNFEANYTPITPAFDIDDHANINLDAVYNWFDDLVTRHPDLLERELIVNEPTGLPIYAYRSKPKQLQEYSENFPKIIHLNGMHGTERQNTLSTMRFYKDLFDHWQENELLELLLFNVEFLVVPAWNAWGFENNQYLNSNGVSFNSNFPSNWVQTDMSGTHPLSEIETQAIYDLIMTEENVIFGVDHHRFNPFSQNARAIWVGSQNVNTNKLLAGWARGANADFIKEHPELASTTQSNIALLEDRTVNQTGVVYHAFNEAGFPGMILEISQDTAFSDFHTKALGKLFSHAVKELHNDKTKWY